MPEHWLTLVLHALELLLDEFEEGHDVHPEVAIAERFALVGRAITPESLKLEHAHDSSEHLARDDVLSRDRGFPGAAPAMAPARDLVANGEIGRLVVDQIIEGLLIDQASDITLDRGLGNPERVGVEALVKPAHARAVAEQHFHRRTATTEEDEERARPRGPAQSLGDDAAQAVNSPPHVDRVERDEDLDTERIIDRPAASR